MTESAAAYLIRELHRSTSPGNVPVARHGTRWLLRVNNCRASKSEPVSVLALFLLSPLRRPPRLDTAPRAAPSTTRPHRATIFFIHREPSPHRHRHRHRHRRLTIASTPSLTRHPSPIPSLRPAHFSSCSKPSSGRARLDAVPAWPGLRGFVSSPSPSPRRPPPPPSN